MFILPSLSNCISAKMNSLLCSHKMIVKLTSEKQMYFVIKSVSVALTSVSLYQVSSRGMQSLSHSAFYYCEKTLSKTSLGRNEIILTYNVQVIIQYRGKLGSALKEGTWRQKLKQRLWGSAAYWFCSSNLIRLFRLLSYTTENHLPQWIRPSHTNHYTRKCP